MLQYLGDRSRDVGQPDTWQWASNTKYWCMRKVNRKLKDMNTIQSYATPGCHSGLVHTEEQLCHLTEIWTLLCCIIFEPLAHGSIEGQGASVLGSGRYEFDYQVELVTIW